jgi:hypothetical protein
LEFRQGVGRLIQTKTDTGIIMVLDTKGSVAAMLSRFANWRPASRHQTGGPLFNGHGATLGEMCFMKN